MLMVETRRAERVRAFLRARIVFNNQNSTVDCTIKNISATGAKIELSNMVSVPAEFDLEVPQKGRTYRARIMWRDADAIGVEFIERSPSYEIREGQLEKLMAENRKLKMTIKALTAQLEELGQEPSCII